MPPLPLALVVLATPLVRAGAQDPADWAQLLDGAACTLEQAVDRGLEQAGTGVPFHAELELDEGKAVFSIDVAQGERTCNVVLNAKDGKLREKELEQEDHSAEVRAAQVDLKSAIAAAQRSSPGRAIEAELTLEKDQPVITVKVFGAGGLAVVRVDGRSGAVQGGDAEQEPAEQDAAAYTDVFRVDPEEWASTGANPYFILEPGWFLVLEGKEKDQDVRLTVTVLDQTRKVAGVETRIVEEREEQGGQIVEISRNFFAISRRSNSVYYFGEEVDIYRDGKIANHEGAWQAGENGARFGLMMAGTPLLGARYYQEIAPDVAMDRAEIVGLGDTVEAGAGKFEGVLKVKESSGLERGTESKYYAAGVGLVREEDLRLTRYGRAPR